MYSETQPSYNQLLYNEKTTVVGITFPLLPVPDPDLEIRGWGRSSRSLDGGEQSPKNIFSALGPQFGLKIRGGGPPPPGPSPRSATDYAQSWHTFMGEKKTSESDRDTQNIFDFKWKKKG